MPSQTSVSIRANYARVDHFFLHLADLSQIVSGQVLAHVDHAFSFRLDQAGAITDGHDSICALVKQILTIVALVTFVILIGVAVTVQQDLVRPMALLGYLILFFLSVEVLLMSTVCMMVCRALIHLALVFLVDNSR